MSKLLLKCLIIVWVHYIEIPGLHLLSELFLFSQLGPYISTFNVTVPLGLWMFERPGELRLNHSRLKFRTVY